MADLTGMMQAAAGGGGDANYIEDVFSTYVYSGNNSTQVITNGIDLAGEGGLVWTKNRTSGPNSHLLFDTIRGATKYLSSDTTNAEITNATTLTSFNSDGFTLGVNASYNNSVTAYCSWTFRKQPKFFDVVTYTGTGSNRTVAHALGSVPGCIMVKRTDNTGDWQVYHRANTANPETDYLVLNSTAATADSNTRWNDTAPTDAVFTVGTDATVNASGGTYVAYLFAHDAGGFGLTGSDNVISCGSFTTDGSGNATVNLGYEPQWVLFKASSRVLNWSIHDTMRGMPVGSVASGLYPNLADAESNNVDTSPTPTGFTWSGYAGETFVYVAIRRGPMKVPETGTSVFSPIASSASTGTTLTTNFPVDAQFEGYRGGDSLNMAVNDRLRGVSTNATQSTLILTTSSTAAEASPNATMTNFWDNTGFKMPGYYGGLEYIAWNFRRAPGFFDEVCYTGTGSATTFSHNLAAVPELMIVKKRSATDDWAVYAGDNTDFLLLNTTAATADNNTYWNDTNPTSTVFSVGTNADVNTSAATYVAYLFATCPGVSKVGSYTGTGTTKQIDCGFTGGARFVLIKRTDSTGDWYVWDSARGIVSGNDPYLLLNSTAAEVTVTDYVDTYAAGFELSSTAPAAINASGGTYIFLAIA